MNFWVSWGKAILMLVFFWVSQTAFSQNGLTLSKKEMYADFDSLVANMERLSPQLRVKKALWNYRFAAEIAERRKQIDTITRDMSFYLLLQKAMNLNLDMHTGNIGQQSDWAAVHENAYRQQRNAFKLSVANVYVDGTYRVTTPFVLGTDTIEIGTEIVRFNNQNVHEYVATHLHTRSGFTYDLRNKKYYFSGFFKNMETIFMDSLSFTFKDNEGRIKSYKMARDRFTDYLPSPAGRKGDSTRIEFWEPENILYIRVTEMDEAYIPFFETELEKYRNKTAEINKIILDFRGNGGGSDTTWQVLYAKLIQDTLKYRLKIDDLNQPSFTDAVYADRGYDGIQRTKDKLPFKNSFGLYTVTDKINEIEPLPTSLRFKGKIFVLAENHYSSTGSAISVANANPNDNLYTVGRNSGYFLGIGFSPINLKLPITGLSYRISASMEVTNAQTMTDLMQDHIDIFVPYNMDDYRNAFTYSGNLNSKDFLLKYDPFIKKVLEN